MKKIYHPNWTSLRNEEIISLFDAEFGSSIQQAPDGTRVTIAPNNDIVTECRLMGRATLELLENRTASTVYRIQETGVVFQLCQPDGNLFEYDDFETYRDQEAIDSLLKSYMDESGPVHRLIKRPNGEIWVERLKAPRFRGRYTPNDPMSQISDIEWNDTVPGFMEIAKLLRKAGAFLQHGVKK